MASVTTGGGNKLEAGCCRCDVQKDGAKISAGYFTSQAYNAGPCAFLIVIIIIVTIVTMIATMTMVSTSSAGRHASTQSEHIASCQLWKPPSTGHLHSWRRGFSDGKK